MNRFGSGPLAEPLNMTSEPSWTPSPTVPSFEPSQLGYEHGWGSARVPQSGGEENR